MVSNGPNAPALSDGRVCDIGRKMTGTGNLKVIGEPPNNPRDEILTSVTELSNYPTTEHELLKSRQCLPCEGGRRGDRRIEGPR